MFKLKSCLKLEIFFLIIWLIYIYNCYILYGKDCFLKMKVWSIKCRLLIKKVQSRFKNYIHLIFGKLSKPIQAKKRLYFVINFKHVILVYNFYNHIVIKCKKKKELSHSAKNTTGVLFFLFQFKFLQITKVL